MDSLWHVKMVIMAGDRAECRSVAADDYINVISYTNDFLKPLPLQLREQRSQCLILKQRFTTVL
jgi:hypothetical protein